MLTKSLIDFVVRKNEFLPGGTKEACIIVRQLIARGGKMKLNKECCTNLGILLAATFNPQDTMLEDLKPITDIYPYSHDYLKNGTRMACIYMSDFIFSGKAISLDKIERDALITVLKACLCIADIVPLRWRCECDCSYISYLLCKGEMNIAQDAEATCPYYCEEDK